ncbi:hypothetical protein [Marinobacter sp. F4216]|uniref:hypothetical protein n=1 Tax=Marinobacter sp. F4216 TaxID=2874281 RepID=UPI001CBC3F4A|nr:hypothetical protein [Marinobacter sp. F4216]MBZ2169475.1 hypothetical protein [Marinobacter sp. F4216]
MKVKHLLMSSCMVALLASGTSALAGERAHSGRDGALQNAHKQLTILKAEYHRDRRDHDRGRHDSHRPHKRDHHRDRDRHHSRHGHHHREHHGYSRHDRHRHGHGHRKGHYRHDRRHYGKWHHGHHGHRHGYRTGGHHSVSPEFRVARIIHNTRELIRDSHR